MALYKRKTYLINPKFQIKFSLYVAILFAVSTALYPIMIYDLYSEVAVSLKSQFPHASNAFIEKREDLMVALCTWQLLLIFLIFICSIFLSHKIAGPLYKLSQFLKSLGISLDRKKLFFRNGDYFKEIAIEYNQAVTELESKLEHCSMLLDEILERSNCDQLTKEQIIEIKKTLGVAIV